MNILAEVEGLAEQPWGCADHLHSAIEAMRLAFGDALQYNADPDVVPVPIERLVSAEHAKLRRAQIHPDKARCTTNQAMRLVTTDRQRQEAAPAICSPLDVSMLSRVCPHADIVICTEFNCLMPPVEGGWQLGRDITQYSCSTVTTQQLPMRSGKPCHQHPVTLPVPCGLSRRRWFGREWRSWDLF